MARVELPQDVRSVSGAALTGASVQVNVSGGGAAVIYAAEEGLETLPNPLTSVLGRIDGWVESGQQLQLVYTFRGRTYADYFFSPGAGDTTAVEASVTALEAALALLEERIEVLEGSVPPITPGDQVWPVINTSVLGAGYAPLAYPTPTTQRFIDFDNGSDSTGDGLSWDTAWQGLYQAFETVIADPGGAGIEIWCRGTCDLTSAVQFQPASGQMLVANCIDGTAAAPRSVRAVPGTKIINGWVTLRTPNYTRVSGFEFNGYQNGIDGGPKIVADQLLKIESATATAHFEWSYNTFKGGRDQAVIVETGLATDFHAYCNRYTDNGNNAHPDGTPGFFDQVVYLKRCPRFVAANEIMERLGGGYGYHLYDSATSDPGNAARILHPTIMGGGLDAQYASAGWIVDSGDAVKFINFISANHRSFGTHASSTGYAGRWVNATSGGEAARGITFDNDQVPAIQTVTNVTTRNLLTSDPLMVNMFSGEYALLSSSPAKNAGEAWGVLVDHYGRARSQVSPSMGAIE